MKTGQIYLHIWRFYISHSRIISFVKPWKICLYISHFSIFMYILLKYAKKAILSGGICPKIHYFWHSITISQFPARFITSVKLWQICFPSIQYSRFPMQIYWLGETMTNLIINLPISRTVIIWIMTYETMTRLLFQHCAFFKICV